MLVGPRICDGENEFQVVTPLERPSGDKILVNRGWISKKMKDHKNRDRDALPTGEVAVEGLLRSPWKTNMFSPDNRPDIGEFYFPDIQQMAGHLSAQPVWVEETTVLLHLASLQFYIFFFCRFSRLVVSVVDSLSP
jgi:surfeit locus 1 family protein